MDTYSECGDEHADDTRLHIMAYQRRASSCWQASNEARQSLLSEILRAQTWQHLSLLVGEIQLGTFVGLDDPNYDLFCKAARTIQKFLDSTIADTMHASSEKSRPPELQDADSWPTNIDSDVWNFDFGLWDSLSEHPLLAGDDLALQI